jgi:flagellar hook protein FlgE
MGLTSSLATGLSGLNANSQLISVTGNNIANVNTTGFKSNRLDFETQISQELSGGTAPNSTSGGTNPTEIGLGVSIGGSSRDFNDGSLQPTGVNSDLAIQGNGFFVVNIAGNTRYTRDGTFSLDRDFYLVNANGGRVQGFGVNSDFAVIPGFLQDLQIPIGALTISEPTHNLFFKGVLNAGGAAATIGSVNTTDELHTAANSAAGANDALASTALTSLFATGGVSPLFATGDVITLTGATKGGASLPDHTFEVGAANNTGSEANGTTVQDFMDFLQGVLGVDPSAGGSAGLSVAGGQIVITGNTGTVNDLVVPSGSIITNKATNPVQPFTMTKTQSSDGESVRTTFVTFDSLGNSVPIDMAVVLEDKTSTGTAWRFYTQSDADSDVSRVLNNGTLNFDTNGQLIGVTNDTFTIDRAGTGAATPQSVKLAFDDGSGSLSALVQTTSQLASVKQDGSPAGTLQDFSVQQDGTIVGSFSNSSTRVLGQVILATFTNPQGLKDVGSNLYADSTNSGTAALTSPGLTGAGRVIGGAIELSNVDLSKEFINLISASTGFSANSRVLTTSSQLIQDLLAAIR